MTWSAKDIPDQTNKVIIITGANVGLGLAATKHLALKNARVIMACRNENKAAAALEEVREAVAKSNANPDLVTTATLDLSSLESVRQFSETMKRQLDHVDVLLNNAGISNTPFGKTKDGIEQQMGVNHCGHFALTANLMPLLRAAPGRARVVNVSSLGAHWDPVDGEFVKDINFEKREYNPSLAYGESKLANQLFMLEFNRRAREADIINQVAMYAAHPGASASNLSHHVTEKSLLMRLVMKIANSLLFQTAEVGSLPEVRAATDPDAPVGGYYAPGGFKQLRGPTALVDLAPLAADENAEELARDLWMVSEELTGVKFSLA